MYSEEVSYSIDRIADALSRPNNGSCEIVFNEYNGGTDYAIVSIRPANWGDYQRNPPQFYALLTKKYDQPATFELLGAGDNAAAIRLGIKRIDEISDDEANAAEAATQQWANNNCVLPEPDDDPIAF